MPKVPVYNLQANAGGSGTAALNAINLSTPYANAVSNIGNIMEQRGAQILREHDEATALGAFNVLRDEARAKIVELTNREGGNAIGVQKDYDEWERKTRQSIAKQSLTAQTQTTLFDRLANNHRESDLNGLATHEANQHKKHKQQQLSGFTVVVERDMRNAAFDDNAMNQMIGEWFGAVDSLYPGQVMTAEKVAGLQGFRTAAMLELIDKNPKYATQKLEEWKSDLGPKYDSLKKQLESKTTDDKVGAAWESVHNRFGANYEAGMSWLMLPSTQKELGLEFKEINQLHNRLSGLLSDRERAERLNEDRLNRGQKLNAAAVLQSLYNPDAPKVDVHALHRERKIDNATYEHAIKAKESTVIDNPWVVGDIHDAVERGVDVTDQIRQAVDNSNLSERTASSLLKHTTDEKSKRAMQYIDRALKPSDADKWSPDKHLKYADATRLYYAKIASGIDYETAAYEVVNGYIQGIRRTVKMLPIPEGMSQDKKTDLTALEQQKAVLSEKYRTIQITEDVYLEQMRVVDSLIKIATETQNAETSNTELEELRKKKIQK